MSPAESATPITNIPFVVFDTETTGLSSEDDGVIEIAGMRVQGGVADATDTFHSLVNPVRSIPYDAQRVHGITDDQVKEADIFEMVLPQFMSFVGEAVLIAHNAQFDMGFLNKTLENMGWGRWEHPVVCTVRLSRVLFPAERHHDLDSVARRLELPPVERHRALGDITQTAQAFLHFCDQLAGQGRTTFEALRPGLLD